VDGMVVMSCGDVGDVVGCQEDVARRRQLDVGLAGIPPRFASFT
jgi:hypothetical protein